MSKEMKSKHNPSNVVAKLMGLETLSKGEPNLSVIRSQTKDYSQDMYAHLGWPLKHWKVEDKFMMDNKDMLLGVHHPSTEQIGHKDGYETWLQSQRGWWREDFDEGKMALVRKKFIEAKYLSTDKTLRQSKQFQDALDILSSNNDLLVRFLDSQKLYQLPSTPPDDSNCITLIKPLKMFGNDKSSGKGRKNDRLLKKPADSDQTAVWENMNRGYSPESTRIVVLKPSPGRTNELKALVSPTNPSPQSFYRGNANDNVLESIKVAKEIRMQMQMHKGLRSYQKDKTLLLSSAFSNGYSSDDSSYNKSYHDLEAMSPMPRHSWDCINVCGSPYSTQSMGRATCSPESSVCIEAKKRLSERWNTVTAKEKHHQEQRRVARNSTLGEMLSLSLVKKSVTSVVESANKHQEEPSKSISCSQSLDEEMSTDDSSQNVSSANPVPASSTVDEPGLCVDASIEHDDSKVGAKSKSKKSSFKGKVASFFFSMSKKSTKKKYSSSQSKDESETIVTETSVPSVNSPGDHVSQSSNVGGFEESLAALCDSSCKTSTDSFSCGQQEDMITLEPGLTESKSMVLEIPNEKQDRPSPISVLESPFEDYNTSHESLECMKGGHMGSLVRLKSNLIDKSPPIESVARTLSWDEDSFAELTRASSLDTKLEEHDWLLLVQKLLSASGLDDDQEQQHDSFHTRFHSLESPLDPSLRDNKDCTQPLNEAKRRKMRSNQKLVFDCVNAALLEVVGYGGSENYFKMYCGTHRKALVQEGSCLMDHIVTQMKELIANGMRFVWGGDSHSLVVENVVRKEVVVQIGLVEVMKMEIDALGREIEGKIIEELVENVVLDFTGRR
ncbi:uncharacterized protein LOC123899515 [Trifolium pratense]|uniref:uncharacterized protein LOC123899515 n=1 Tax=Trifolium pratense TaxID=57577 RepID=UPI001E696E06|nr:uncharacterized protein LOC123899515 [Trifolium pratense]XP_045806631.1 uncharacterized protein LOC123899515 [Trifolium pratense]XP_045806638.1 uncharacterized protein LOC123899515 [Trifolium pratense]XP_045806646.1 uncharacterized protein LOC123899515 [Trifolium pratense]XP_045806654.1 uncharacterized protein LOC123899515 [Trifolium pratense]